MNILTFDIEEWFHILDNDSTRTEKEWENYNSRLNKNMDYIFAVLESAKQRATFFCLGWIAKKYPEIIKQIDSYGYEVASHSNMHQLVFEQNKRQFSEDLDYSIKLIEDLTGKKVKSYRAPGFSIKKENNWAFEILLEKGIERDCSIFPASRAHGGYPEFKEGKPSLIQTNGTYLKEFPINTYKFLGKDLIFSGGGYFRLLPWLMLNHLDSKSDYVMTYFHPRDFDEGQPVLEGLPLSRKFKSYVGLKSSKKKLSKWLNKREFVDLEQADKIIDWDKTNKVIL